MLGVPHHAMAAWRALLDALEANPVTPCRTMLTPEQWFTPSRPQRKAAAAACAGCPVLLQCQAYAYAAPERTGIWGGMLPEERRNG
ncbi:WhiB family transcriptional regulator [Paenarthrobacter sp. DKR-5]|nr:WhiB family transcriptional regulator [Paenarthrobacter sp. DKR-5]